jgi:hypothetical protein
MPRGNIHSKRELALATPCGMLANDVAIGSGSDTYALEIGFIGGVGAAPIAPTTFVFGQGTALRTRNL